MEKRFYIHKDIRKAETLPASFYRDPEIFEEIKEKVFLKSWQWVGDENLIPLSNSVYPFIYLEHYLDEPVVLIRQDNDEMTCLSNVCTHRGNLVVQHAGTLKFLQCSYHGRRFDNHGKYQFMPEFKEALDFPRTCESLVTFSLKQWSQFLFVGLEPSFDFSSVIEKMKERIYFLPLREFKHSDERSQDYLVNCHWALYCDNYLEGFHIPFVHDDLNKAIDYGQYVTEIYEHCNLQIGYTKDSVNCFKLPEGHPDFNKKVAAYYYWVYPNMMFNFYPWGLSINIVRPISPNKTRVSFITYVYDEDKIDIGAGALLDKVEREDEVVVEGVHKGLRSRYYTCGRFSPKREKGVHQFHRLLADALNHP